MAHRVELLGVVDEVTKARVLAAADLLVAPNTGGESFGIVLVEAMAAGLPVVASDLPAFVELLGDGGGRLFPVGDHEALADTVDELLADPVLRDGIGRSRDPQCTGLRLVGGDAAGRGGVRIRGWSVAGCRGVVGLSRQ